MLGAQLRATQLGKTRRHCQRCGASAWVLAYIRYGGLCSKCFDKQKKCSAVNLIF